MEWWGIVGTVLAGIAAAGTIWFGVSAARHDARADARAIEPRDVVWKGEPTPTGFVFRHTSAALHAKDVLIVLTVDGATEIERRGIVRAGERVEVESAAHVELVRVAAAEGPTYEDPEFGTFDNVQRSVSVAAIIAWRYPSGVGDRQELAWVETY